MYKSDDEQNIKGASPTNGNNVKLASDLIEAVEEVALSDQSACLSESTLSDRIETAITAGIRRGQAETRRRRIRFRRRIGGAAAACLLLFACIFSIRVSPVFAAMVRDIPGFEKFVDLIRTTQDQGIGLALDNDFVQKIGLSDEHDGMKLTVQGIIVDDSRMVLFYSIQLPDKESYAEIGLTDLMDGSGTDLQASWGITYSEKTKQDIAKTGVQRGSVDINLADGVFPDEVVWKMNLKQVRLSDLNEQPMQRAVDEKGSEASQHTADGTDFQVRFPIDREKFAGLRQEYVLNQTIVMEGQKITFAKAIVSPLRVSLYLDYDAANSKQIFGPGDIRLIDDQGTEWKQYLGNLAKDHPVFHFESPYFNEPKSLHIEGNWFRALDRDKMQVTVDTVKGEVLQAPDNQLSLHQIVQGGADLKLDFELNGVNEEDKMGYSLFEREFQDAEGRTYATAEYGGTMTTFEPGRGNQHIFYYIDNQTYKQPLTFTISSYPQYIRQPYSIRIK